MSTNFSTDNLRGLLRELMTFLASRQKRREALRTPLFANSIYLLLNTGANAVLGLVFWVTNARLYTVADVGLGSALISAMGFLSFIGTLGLGFGLIRFLPGAGTKAPRMINSTLTLSAVATVLVAAVFVAGTPIWSPAVAFIREKPAFLVAFILFVVASTLSAVLGSVFIGLRRAGFSLAQNTATNLLKVGLAVSLGSFFGAFGIFGSGGLAAALSMSLGLFLLLPSLIPGYRPTPSLDKKMDSEMVRFSLANYVSEGLWAVPGWLLPLIVVNLQGSRISAYFYLSWALASLLIAIPTSIATSLFAEGSHREGNLARDVRRSLKLILVLLLPAMLVLVVVGEKLLLIFGREYSTEGANLLRILIPSALPVSANVVYMSIAKVKNRLKDVIWITAASAIGTLVLSYLLMPHLGILGVGIAYLVSQSLTALVSALKIRTLLASVGDAHKTNRAPFGDYEAKGGHED